MKIDPSDLASASDVARMMSVGNPAVSNWQSRYPDFPKPVATVSNGHTPLFLRSEVVAWYKTRISPELLAELRR